MKIIITNTVTLNTGDASILQGEMRILKKTFGSETQFVIYDSQPDVAKRYYPDLIFRKQIYLKLPGIIRRYRYISRMVLYLNMLRFCIGALALRIHADIFAKLILPSTVYQDFAEYRSADLIVATGGTFLVENYDLKPRFFDFVLTLLMGKPLVLFTQSLGPFQKPINRFFIKQIFNRTDIILLRDERSKRHLIDLGVKESNLHVCADAAFAFVDKASLLRASQKTIDTIYKCNVAISVREWKYFKSVNPEAGIRQYKNSIRDLCIHLIQHYNARITFLSTCQGIPEYWTDDSRFAAEIIETLPPVIRSHVQLNDKPHNPQQLIDLLRTFDFVVSTRLHMAILSLCSGIPVLSIAYEFKTMELFKRFCISDFALDIEQLTPQKLVETTDRFIHSIPDIRESLFKAVEQEHLHAFKFSQIIKLSLYCDAELNSL